MKKNPRVTFPEKCPGLFTAMSGCVYWSDSTGKNHSIAYGKRIQVAGAARKLKLSTETVREKIKTGELYPVFKHKSGHQSLLEAGVVDFVRRNKK